ncbi:hypothetical protein CR513_54696, partial [Mucuna pruriens]
MGDSVKRGLSHEVTGVGSIPAQFGAARRVVSELSSLKGVLLARIMEFKEGTSPLDHLNEFQGVIDQMSEMGIKFEDEILRLLFLNSLLESWENFKGSITNSTPNDENKGKKGKSKEKDDDDDDDDDRVTTATDFESVNLVSDKSMWIIDSGTTLHVTPRKEFFTSYTSGDFGVLKMGNDGVTKVIGVGDVCL